jgi:hypothetical protein
MERNPLSTEPECEGEHVRWLHEILCLKNEKLAEPEDEGKADRGHERQRGSVPNSIVRVQQALFN